jgi:hypothetical protein
MRGRISAGLSVVLALLVTVGTAAAFLWLNNRAHPGQPLPGLATQTPTAAPLAGAIQPSASGTYWGVFLPGAPLDQSVVTSFTSVVGREPAILSMYQQWWGEPSFPATTARWMARRGAVPLIIWEPWQPALPAGQSVAQPKYRLSVIAAGGFDRYVRHYADQVRGYAGPLFLEPLHEMNGNWYPWGGTVNGNTTADYIAAWRHLHDVFQAEGATNVTWVWTSNRDSVPNTPDNRPANYWPGPEYVDWVGVDAYNWGTAEHKQWMTVAQTFGPSLAALRAYGKPIIVAETACAEQGGDKASWITGLFTTLTKAYSGMINAAVWFNEPFGVFDWRTNSSPAAQSAFNAGVALPGMLSASQVVWSSRPPSPAASMTSRPT